MWRLAWMAAISASLALALAGCDLMGHRVSVPPGSQVGHIVVGGDTLTLDPSSVPSGDIYFVIEGSPSSLGLVTGSGGGWPPPPLTDADVARLTNGDRQRFTFSYGIVGEDNILKLSGLLPGKYALILDPDDSQTGIAAGAIAILTVLP
jgi:hypothetical protein